jgi:2-succinyl-6-hydroxy-2,4-cyclohexadiene-1-carboxylate synthase
MIYALHGFLGLPEDWKGMFPQARCIDVLEVGTPGPKLGILEWAKRLNQLASPEQFPRILLGYSLGGRLAMHALADRPDLWSAAVIISAHPGLKTQEEKQKRLIGDRQWAERFETESWDHLMQAWNSQAVFTEEAQPRQEKNYLRDHLCNVFRYWSLGHQEDMAPQLAKLSMPILWIAGEKDFRYALLANQVQLAHPNSQVWIAPNSGHRVPWSCRQEFMQKVNHFIKGAL